MALGTVVWDAYHTDRTETFANLPPHYKEFDNIYDLMDNLTHIQSMLYNPNYILVEFEGILYDVSKPDGENAQRLIRAMIDSKIDEYNELYNSLPCC